MGSKPLTFVGMMGCGKSAIGRLTAECLGLPFFDADSEIEKAADMSVAEIFENYGEGEFRRGEQRVIERLVEAGPSVIALGGGAFVNDETRSLLKEKSISIWIDADLETLLARVLKRPGKRPLLMNGDPRAILIDLMEKRLPVYRQAELAVASSQSSKTKTRDNVLDALHDHLCGQRMVQAGL